MQCRTRAQKAAKKLFEELIAHVAKADQTYNRLGEPWANSDGGRIISTDLARFLDERYRATQPGRPRDLAPSWNGAWRYAQNRLERELSHRGKREQVRFMAGGWAAGKTHALEKLKLVKADLVWDGTLRDVKWASRMIEEALTSGWRVEVVYVHRDIELAIYGAIERARSEGRGVPLRDLPSVHREVQQTILELMRRFSASPDVAFILLHNTGAPDCPGPTIELNYSDLEPGGGLHYAPSYERYYGAAAEQIRKACVRSRHLGKGVCE